MEEEHAGVEQAVCGFGMGVRGVRDRCWGLESAGMRKRCVGAVGGGPVGRGPGVVVKVADAGVVGADPVAAGEADGEGAVDVFVDGDVGVEEDEGVVGGELEGAEFGPGVFEAGCDEGGILRARREEEFDGVDF